MASKRSPMRVSSSSAAADLRTCRSTLFAASSCCGAVAASVRELVVPSRRRAARQRRLDQALGDEVGEAAVGRRRVGVVLDRQAEVTRGRPPGALDDVLAGAQQLDHREREVGEPVGSALRRWARNADSAFESGSGGRRSPCSCASATIRSQRSGERSDPAQRREALLLQEARVDAVGRDHEVLDQLLGAVAPLRPQVGERVAVEDRRASRVSRSSAPCSCRSSFSLRATRVLQAELLVDPGHAAHGSGAGAVPVQPRRHARRRRAWPGCAPSPRYTSEPAIDPPASTVISTTIASRSTPSFSDVRSVESRSGSIGKISAAV